MPEAIRMIEGVILEHTMFNKGSSLLKPKKGFWKTSGGFLLEVWEKKEKKEQQTMYEARQA